MKVKKVVLFIVTIAIMLVLNSSYVYASVAPLKNILPAAIMRLSIFVILFIYIISSIIYFAKSKKSKNEKLKRLIIWLVIVIVICLILKYGADFILKNARRR